MTAQWLGQDGSNCPRPGDVHVVLGQLPSSSRLRAIALTDTLRGAWQYRSSDRVPALLDGSPGGLEVQLRPDRGTADFYFTPYRDARSDTFSARLVGDDGRQWYVRFAGGPCDLDRLAPAPEATRAEARPGDDLQALVDRNGTVVLAAGTYRLVHPLVLKRPVTVKATGGATLVFAQDPDDPPWTTAIKVHGSRTTLEGFAVRFAGPVRWNGSVSYGPAVIGMTDNLDTGPHDPKIQVRFRNLDLEIPAAEDPTKMDRGPAALPAGRGVVGRDRRQPAAGRADRVLPRSLADRRQ